jgi:acyl carrier protein
MNRETILENVIYNVNNIVETFPKDQQFAVSEATVLFGLGSQIDSLSLVNVIVDLEMQFSSDYNIELSLTDDRAMARTVSPFTRVETLVDYIHELLSESSQ